MKKLFLAILLTMSTGIVLGQSLQKGNVIGIHNFSLNLDPDVTLNRYKDFFIKNYIPELDKHYPDVKHYFSHNTMSDNKDNIGLIVVFGSPAIKDKYYNEDGSRTELTIAIQEKMKSTREELDKLGSVTAEYTEWIIL